MNEKIYIGFTSDQLNLIQELLEYEIEEHSNFEDESEDYIISLKEIINNILKEV